MLKTEVRLELNVPSNELGVNQVIAFFSQIQEQLGSELVARYLEQAQERVLERVLGPKWSNEDQEEAPWSCPECGSAKGFSRRGSYPRVLRKSSLGRISFELRQVTCRRCGHTFSPFPKVFGLEPRQASTTEFQAKAVKVACQTSYARAVRHIGDLAGVPVSATAVHQWVQDQGTSVSFDAQDADGKPVIVDSTKVCAGEKERGALLNLGLSIRRRDDKGARPSLELCPICFGVAESWKETGQALDRANPDRVVFDGDEAITQWAETTLPDTPKQRGIWHLVNKLYWPLWRDGLHKTDSDPWMGRLGELLYHAEDNLQKSKEKLNELIQDLSEQGFHEGVTYLARAAPYVFTYREKPDGVFQDAETGESRAIRSTSPVERQMREINRRTDVGVRWTVSGVENLTALDLVRRFDPGQWQALWQLPEHAEPDYSDVKLRIQARGEPSPNVKTS